MPACTLDMTLTHPCCFAQVRILPHQARSRRFVGPEERTKSDGFTSIVSRIHVDAESTRRHGTARLLFRVLPREWARSSRSRPDRTNGVRLVGARSRPKYGSRAPSLLLSMSACMSMACSCAAGEIVRDVAVKWRSAMAQWPSPWLAARRCDAAAAIRSGWRAFRWPACRCERLFPLSGEHM